MLTWLTRALGGPRSQHTGTATCQRAFVQFCYNPIKQVIEAAMNDNREKLLPMLEKLGVKSKLKQDDFLLSGKPLMKRVMQTWMPAHEARSRARPARPPAGRPLLLPPFQCKNAPIIFYHHKHILYLCGLKRVSNWLLVVAVVLVVSVKL